MGKIEVFVIVFLAMFMIIGVVSAANESNTGSENDEKNRVENAYACLEEKLDKSLSLQEVIFSILALGNKNNLLGKLDEEKKQESSGECWPKSGCKIKDTAQAMMAYKRLGKNTDAIEKWILSKNASLLDLDWFLEIDILDRESSECKIKYSNIERKIRIGEDMKISGEPGSCLSISDSGYWLEIKESCYDKKFEISCDSDFISTLIYTKKNGESVYVSSKTSSAPSGGSTSEEINARCLKSGNVCDYEGSLWAVVALEDTKNDVDTLKPYTPK